MDRIRRDAVSELPGELGHRWHGLNHPKPLSIRDQLLPGNRQVLAQLFDDDHIDQAIPPNIVSDTSARSATHSTPADSPTTANRPSSQRRIATVVQSAPR